MADPNDTKPLKDYVIPTDEESHYSIAHPLNEASGEALMNKP